MNVDFLTLIFRPWALLGSLSLLSNLFRPLELLANNSISSAHWPLWIIFVDGTIIWISNCFFKDVFKGQNEKHQWYHTFSLYFQSFYPLSSDHYLSLQLFASSRGYQWNSYCVIIILLCWNLSKAVLWLLNKSLMSTFTARHLFPNILYEGRILLPFFQILLWIFDACLVPLPHTSCTQLLDHAETLDSDKFREVQRNYHTLEEYIAKAENIPAEPPRKVTVRVFWEDGWL